MEGGRLVERGDSKVGPVVCGLGGDRAGLEEGPLAGEEDPLVERE